MSVQIRKVVSNADKKAFIDFPHELYKNDPNYVPELYLAMADLISEKEKSLFQTFQC